MLGFRRCAERTFRTSLIVDPNGDVALVGLARLMAAGGSGGITYDPVLGLVPDAEANAGVARSMLESGTIRYPTSVDVRLELSRLCVVQGDVAAARAALSQALAIDAEHAEAHYLLARTYAAEADLAGGFTADGFRLHSRHAETALELDPSHTSARYHLVRVAIRAGDWSTVRSAITFSSDVAGEPATSTLEIFDETPDRRALARVSAVVRPPTAPVLLEAPQDWWFAVHWRLLHLGRHRAAFDAKRIAAEQQCSRSGSLAEFGVNGFASVIRSLIFLERHDEARARCVAARATTRSHHHRHVLDVLSSDIEFSLGRPPMSSRRPEPLGDGDLDAAEARFRELIAGRRVAVVGPAPLTVDRRSEIEEFDVVVRTKALPGDRPWSAPCVSYYATTSSRLLVSSIDQVLGNGDVDLAVFRPNAWPVIDRGQLVGARVRLTRTEYSLGLGASSFAIQRILHDVLRYRPSGVKVFNADLFVSDHPYDPAYRNDRTSSYEDAGLLPNLDGYGHDLLADFRLTRNLVSQGTIEVPPEIAAILDLAPSEYLDRLDALPARSRPTDV